MGDIKKWFQPETTRKPVFEGLYPCVIMASKSFEKEVEKDRVKSIRECISLTFKTLADVPFPDQTSGEIVVENTYYQDVPFHVNALNGIARACGITKLEHTDQFEAKTCLIGIINETYQNKDNEDVTVAKFGYGLFSYAPLLPDSKIEFIANDFPNGDITEDDYKKWFKDKIAAYKSPR